MGWECGCGPVRGRDKLGGMYLLAPPAGGAAGALASPEPTCITADQRRVHMVSEAAALAIVAPFMVWLTMQKELPPAARVMSGGIALATVAIDGALLVNYLSSRNDAG